MIADDKQRITIHFEQSKVLIFQKFPKNFSTGVVKTLIYNIGAREGRRVKDSR